ncbi:MAG: FadR family transcriptional regulator [Chloroflexi bacterium]|nr:FadR family transcriptional regulator [Chloroflexota bacterium]
MLTFWIVFCIVDMAGGFTRLVEEGLELDPLEVQSLKSACVGKLQEAILSGKFAIGDKLPSERDLAKMLGVSRPVLHEALVALNAQGLVHIEARRGVFVRDYRRESSMALLQTLLKYEQGDFNPDLFRSLIAGRLLIERETARLAALQCDTHQKERFHSLLEEGRQAVGDSTQALCDYDYRFHLEIALASGNQMYPMILNSLKGVHSNLAGKFYRHMMTAGDVQQVLAYHRSLVDAICRAEADQAEQIMETLLRHGEETMIRIVYTQ